MTCFSLPACSSLLNDALLTKELAVKKRKASEILLHDEMGVDLTHHFVSNSVKKTALESLLDRPEVHLLHGKATK